MQGTRTRFLHFKRIENCLKALDFSLLKELEMPDYVFNGGTEEIESILGGKRFTLGNDSLEEQDIRAAWEPARLQHAAVLTGALLQNRIQEPAGRKMADFAKKCVLDWIDENPFPRGKHYLSAMECALRIPVFFSCIKAVPMAQEQSVRFLVAMYQHAWLISNRLSLYSSLGNHTVAEATGLVFAGAVFRNLPAGAAWLKRGVQLLEQEAAHQILEDGGPAEQSFSYHRFVLDLYWLAVSFLEKNRIRDCETMKHRLLKGEQFLSAFERVGEFLPNIGDCDDGHAVAPGVFPKRPVISGKPERLKIFKESGYSVVRLQSGVRIVLDHGPLGMAPFYNHGHADALSITLGKNGKDLLMDPGAYRYNGVPEYRKYFKGTRAHNTVTIDGLDQAVQETSFIWSKPYRTVLEQREQTEGAFCIRVSHDGYTRLKQPVKHRRALVCLGETGLLIQDSFLGEGNHTFELNYHLHPDGVCENQNGWFVVENKGERIFLKLLDTYHFRIARGEENPLLGWYSPAYGIKMESEVLSCRVEGTPGNISFLTAIGFDQPLDDVFVRKAEALL